MTPDWRRLQDGFLPRMNQLTPTTLQEVLAPSASTAASPSLHEAYGDSAATAVISMVQRMRQVSLWVGQLIVVRRERRV